MTNWIDLLDPSDQELQDALPETIHESALKLIRRHAQHEDEPRPRLEGQGDYVFGVLLVAVAVPEEDRVFYQEIDLVLTINKAVTIRKTPQNGTPFDMTSVQATVHDDDGPGMIAYRLVDEVIEDYLHLVDQLGDEVEELDDHIEDWAPQRIRRRMADLRHDMLHIRRTLSPTRDAIRQVVDDRADIDQGTCFP